MRSMRISNPRLQAIVSPPVSTDATGQIHSAMSLSAVLMLARLGSAFSPRYMTTFSAATISGRPKTAKARLDQPFTSPCSPQ